MRCAHAPDRDSWPDPVPGRGRRARGDEAWVSTAVAQVIPPLMRQQGIPGMAVGVTLDGRPQVFAFGTADRAARQPVSPETLFEVGSVTKTFTATLAAYAQEAGALSLSDPVERFLPELKGTPFGALKLVHLGTHTSGGLPLQVPASVGTLSQMLAYFRSWRPAAAAGTLRTYSNPGVGAFGLTAARSLGRDFGPLIEAELLPGLGLHHTYLRVPAGLQATYAQGYGSDGAPVRMTPGVFWEEAYGIKTTVGDLLHFLEENLGVAAIGDPRLARAVQATHTGYFRAGPLTQDLMWEQYAMPVALGTLLEGNGAELILNPAPATALVPPLAPRGDVWINKTGSTSGFGVYVAFVPQARLGIVLLANKNYPIPERIKAAYAIQSRLKNVR
ncbi:MAG TPA: class C beta-lactamase [Opitutaceae bacterium]